MAYESKAARYEEDVAAREGPEVERDGALHASKEIDEQLEMLDHDVGRFIERLDAVLIPDHPRPVGDEVGQDRAEGSHLRFRAMKQRDRLLVIRARLNDACERLDL